MKKNDVERTKPTVYSASRLRGRTRAGYRDAILSLVTYQPYCYPHCCAVVFIHYQVLVPTCSLISYTPSVSTVVHMTNKVWKEGII
jgi:hypothetical protein